MRSSSSGRKATKGDKEGKTSSSSGREATQGDRNDDNDDNEDDDEVDSEEEDDDTVPNEEMRNNAVYRDGRLVSSDEASKSVTTKKSSSKKKRRGGGGAKGESGSDGDDDDEDDTKALAAKLDPRINLKMPHNIECPKDMDEFSELIKKYVLCSEDAKVLVDRITIWNSVHLPGEEGKANRKKMYVFLDVLLKYFIVLADALSSNDEKAAELLDQIDHLTIAICKISQDLAESMPAFWGNQIKLHVTQLQKRLRNFRMTGKSAWPSLGSILIMKVVGIVFSTSDFKNAVVSAATLYFAQCLNLCPVYTTRDISSGLLICSILLDYTAESKRWIPEISEFLRSVLTVFGNGQVAQFTFNVSSVRALAGESMSAGVTTSAGTLSWSAFNEKADSNHILAVLQSALKLTEICLSRQEKSCGYPELALPILQAMCSISSDDSKRVVDSFMKALSSGVSNVLRTRESLCWRVEKKVAMESLAPKFDVDYAFKKETGLSKDKLTLKQLNKQAKREHKAVVRELRRDADFLNQEKYKEDKKADDSRKAERYSNFAWLQDQVATMNQHVKKNKGSLSGGGSGISKKPVVRGNKARR
jgi:nucleolar protein 14